MTFTITEVSDFERLITVLLKNDHLHQAENRAARRLAQNVNINGFRRGKAPRRMVERVVGTERIRHEAIEDLLGERLAEIWKETDLEPAIRPVADDLQEVPEGIEVKVSVTLWPSIAAPPDYVGRQIAIEVPEEVSEEMVDKQLAQIREQHAEYEAVERPAQSGDYVSIDISSSKDGTPLEEPSAIGYLHEMDVDSIVEELTEENLTEHLLGCEAGETVEFDAVLRVEVGDLAVGEVIQVRVDIDEVHRKNLPEPADEWVSEAFDCTLAELREQIFTGLDRSRLEYMQGLYRVELLKELAEEMNLDLPAALVDSLATPYVEQFVHNVERVGKNLEEFMEEMRITEEQLWERYRADARNELVRDTLLKAVVDQAEITVETEEILDIVNRARAHSDETGHDIFEGQDGINLVSRAHSDILRSKAVGVLLRGAVPTDQNGTLIDLQFPPLPTDETVEAEVVEPVVEQGEK